MSNSPGLLEESGIGASGTLIVIDAGDGGSDELLPFFRRAADTRFVLFFFVAAFFVVVLALVVFFAAFLPDRFAAARFAGDFAVRFLVDVFLDFLLVFLATMVVSSHSQLLSCLILLNLTNRFLDVYA